MFKLSGILVTFFFVLYIGWVMLPADDQVRLERACQPVNWVGNVTLSMAAFVKPDLQGTIDGFFQKTDYACQYTLWRLIYEDDYRKQQQLSGQ